MEDSTLGTIYALKHTEKDYDKTVIDYWSEYTGTPVSHYEEESLTKIARNVFIDYIQTADNPSCDLENLFSGMPFDYKPFQRKHSTFDKTIRNAIWSALVCTRVRKDGNYVNGFRELKEYIGKVVMNRQEI